MMARALLIGLIAASVALPAAAQMREGMPPVADMRPDMPAVEPGRIAADPDAGRYAATGSFASWNRAHSRPRILVYWDRRLDDETSTRYRTHNYGAAVSAVAPGVGMTAYDSVQQRERLTGGVDGGIGTGDSDDLETAFVSAFIDAGANLADRSALMRKVSTREGREDRDDQQFVESLALEQGVAYLVQVSPTYRGTGSGYSFAVKVTHLPTSRIVAQFRTNAQPNAGPETFVAARGGFQRTRANRNTPDLIGRTLAADVMTRLQ